MKFCFCSCIIHVAVFKNLLPKEEYFSQGLYTFDIGQNDLTAAYFSGMTTDEVIAAVPDILKHFSEIVKVKTRLRFYFHAVYGPLIIPSPKTSGPYNAMLRGGKS